MKKILCFGIAAQFVLAAFIAPAVERSQELKTAQISLIAQAQNIR